MPMRSLHAGQPERLRAADSAYLDHSAYFRSDFGQILRRQQRAAASRQLSLRGIVANRKPLRNARVLSTVTSAGVG